MGNGLDKYDLTGRVALITGANTHGIGNEAAKLLASNGAKVFLTARREEKLVKAVEEIEAAGGVAAYKVTDVSREEDCKAAVEACVDTFGRLDIMVLSAGTSGKSISGGMEAVFDTENWNAVLGTNLSGTFWMIKHGYQECGKHGKGAIIPIGSLASWHVDGSAAYTATKYAIRGLTPWLAKALAPYGVRVNTFYPGLIDTDMTSAAVRYDAFIKPELEKTPLGRVGEVEDCAQGILFLASDASEWMTGQHLVFDGGRLCCS